MDLIRQLDSCIPHVRLASLERLRILEQHGMLDSKAQTGPRLPSYDHIHTSVSYGSVAPGVYSVSHMVWAAHEARAVSISIIEHESLAHCEEARRAVAIVNRGMDEPMQWMLGVEFKAPIAQADDGSQRFRASMARAWGQGEAAWVVGLGIRPCEELAKLVHRFQRAKRVRARRQLEGLNRHLGIMPPLMLSELMTTEGNITDRAIALGAAMAKWPDADAATLGCHARDVRAMLNPGGPGYTPFAANLPSYQDLVGTLAHLGMTPAFTSQLREPALSESLPSLISWGIGALDTAGIEPDEPNAEEHIQDLITLAHRFELSLLGGSDYRGTGTGWRSRAAWMDHPLFQKSHARMRCRAAAEHETAAEVIATAGNFEW